ncbi:MAG: TraB/GumN family protein [Pseudomonadota bacterium]
MPRCSLAFLLFLLPALAVARPGLLFTVADPAGETAGWVYASLPSADPRDRRTPARVEAALGRADALVVGVRPDGTAHRRVAAERRQPPGSDLRDQLGLELFARTARALEGGGLSREELAQLRPWAVILALATPAGAEPAGPVLPLVQRARRDRLPVRGLESAAERIVALSDLPVADQVGLIAHLADFRPRLAEWQARQEAAWRAGDLEAVAREYGALVAGADAEVADAFRERVMAARGQRMAARLASRLGAGGRPLAVLHAAHVPVVLERLEAAGYTVTRAD